MENQQYITIEELQSLGIKLDESNAQMLIEHINDTIEERIGAEITESLLDDKVAELAELEESASEEELGEWIATNVPDFADIVQDNIDIVVGETAQQSESLSA